jgi:glycosyltransferase involved in cell wall biosynthesis
MSCPNVSVIIPAYNQAQYLGETIQSVLDQTYQDIEIIVVDDASTDDTSEVVRQFQDPRLKYIVHTKNRMLAAARNTGIRASSGEVIGCLDADDLFHPQKIEKHVAFLERNPEIGITYNSRFEIDSLGNILDLREAPLTAGLSDFVLGFPFAPSDMIARRECLFHVNLYDESYLAYSEDIDIACRLALAGYKFANVGGPLNYRRRYPERHIRNVSGRLESAVRALESAFADPRCPSGVRELRSEALGKTYLIWSYLALSQNETTLGQEFIRRGIRIDQSFVENEAQRLLESWTSLSVLNGGDHEVPLRTAFSLLPPELAWISRIEDTAVALGYLYRGIRDIVWGRLGEGKLHLEKSASLGVRIDEQFLSFVAANLLSYEMEFGYRETKTVLKRISRYLLLVGRPRHIRQMKARYFFNLAFRRYRAAEYSRVPGLIAQAFLRDPRNLFNRGVVSILIRSFVRRLSLSAGA